MLISGGTSGIGLATARRLIAEGARVWVLGSAAETVSAALGRLPVGASDVAAASIGSRAYIVGGYTVTTPLRSILGFVPGQPLRRVARPPRPLRYAPVGAVAGALYIAGGTSGTAAQRAVFRFDPRTGRVTQVGELPRPLTHAAGASL